MTHPIVPRPPGLTPLQALRSRTAPLAKTALLRLGGYSALRTLVPSRNVAILRYHAICGDEANAYAAPGIRISPGAFEAHVRFLADNYSTLPMAEIVDRLRDGRPLPRNTVAVTFDDGYADNLPAARTLHRHGLSATFYIAAGCLGDGEPFWPSELRHLLSAIRQPRLALHAGPVDVVLDVATNAARATAVGRLTRIFKAHPIDVRDALREQLRTAAAARPMPRVMLTWDEVREMHALGMTIGSHTMTHPNLPSAGPAVARAELVESRKRLEREIEAPVRMFSYPNGGAERYMTPDVQQLVREAGYAAAATSHNAFAGRHSDLYALERIEVEERLEDLAFALEVERFAFKPEPRAAERRQRS